MDEVSFDDFVRARIQKSTQWVTVIAGTRELIEKEVAATGMTSNEVVELLTPVLRDMFNCLLDGIAV